MTMLCLKATLPALLALLAACAGVSAARDALRAEAEQAAEGRGFAVSQTHDFERALTVAASHKQ
ncbi:MAG: hypothetical protein ACLPTM_13770 [Steroidobacteraceae bacterium]